MAQKYPQVNPRRKLFLLENGLIKDDVATAADPGMAVLDGESSH